MVYCPLFHLRSDSSLALTHPLLSARLQKQLICPLAAFSNRFPVGLELKYIWGGLNIEGKPKRTEAALRGLGLYSNCVVLMSTLVKSVEVQIHANRRPVHYMTLNWWLPL